MPLSDEEAVFARLQSLGWQSQKRVGPAHLAPPGVHDVSFPPSDLVEFYNLIVEPILKQQCLCEGAAYPCHQSPNSTCIEAARDSLRDIHAKLTSAGALKMVIDQYRSSAQPGPGHGASLAAALGDDDESSLNSNARSAFEPYLDTPYASSAPSLSDSPRSLQSRPGQRDSRGSGSHVSAATPTWKAVEKWERAFWDVIFDQHSRTLGTLASRARARHSTPALMRQLAFTTFKTLVKDLVFFGQGKAKYMALGFHRTKHLQDLLERASKEIKLPDGKASVEAMRNWLKSDPELTKYLRNQETGQPIDADEEYLCVLPSGTPKTIHLWVGVCSCIRSTLSDHNPDAPLTLNLKGLHGQSSLNDLGIAVQEALASQLPGFVVPVQHGLMLAVEYATSDSQKGIALLLWRKGDGEWEVSLPPGLSMQPQLFEKHGKSPFVLTGMLTEGTRIQVCLRQSEEKVPSPHLTHEAASALLTVLMNSNGKAAAPHASSSSSRRPAPPLSYSSEEIDMASLLMSMAKPSGDREDRFLKDVEALCGSDEFRRRKIGYLPVHWHALFDAVMGKGGYEKVCIARRGEWAHIARQLYGKTFQEHFGGLLRKHYKEVLLKYEQQVRDEQDTQMIMPGMDEEDEERMSREPFGQLLREGGVPMEIDGSPSGDISMMSGVSSASTTMASSVTTGVLSLTQQFEELLKGWLMQACDKQQSLTVMGKHLGYGEMEGIKGRVEDLVDRLGEGRAGETTSVLVYGSNGVGKSTITQCLLRLGEAPQELYLQLVKSYEEELEAFQMRRNLFEASVGGDLAKLDELMSTVQRVDPDHNEMTKVQAQAGAERDAHDSFRKYCEGDGKSLEGKAPFLLPDAETITCTKIRYGRRYHVLFVYEDEKEVRRQLETYNWKHMADLADSPKLTDEDRKSYDYHKRLYAAVVDRRSSGSAASGTDAMDTGKDEWESGKDENADEMEEDGPSWLRQAVSSAGPGTAASEANAANDAEFPLWNLTPGELVMKEEVQSVLGKAVVHVGQGFNVMDDRVYIKDVLKRKLAEPHAICLKEVVVFAPCMLLEGDIELVDGPTSVEDTDPVSYRNLAEAVGRADHIMVVLGRDLNTSWNNTTDMLVRQGVFRRRLGMTGEKPVQLSFIICSEKEEALSGTDVLKEEWAGPFVETFKEAVATIQRSVNLLLRDACRQAGRDPSRLPVDKSSVITSCYPVLFTSLMLNAGYRQKHAKDIATMLERTQGTDLLSVITQQSQIAIEKRCEELKQYLQAKVASIESGMSQTEKPLPTDVCLLAQAAWQQRETAKTSVYNSFEQARGVRTLSDFATTGSLSTTYDHCLDMLLDVLGRRLDVAMEELQRHVTETEEKLLREAEGHAAEVAVVQASSKMFEAVKRGRDRELSWLTVVLDKVLGSEDTIAAIKRLCAEVKEQIKMFQDSVVMGFNDEMEKAMIPWHAEALADKKRPLRDRLTWFEQVRLRDELERWTSLLPEWRKEEGMATQVREVLLDLLQDLLPEIVTSSKKPAEAKRHLATQVATVKRDLRAKIKAELKEQWAMRWRVLREEAESHYGGLWKVYRDFVKGLAANQAPRSVSNSALLQLLRRALESLDMFFRALKARRSGRAVELSRQLLERLSPAHSFLAELTASAAEVGMPPIEGTEAFQGPAAAAYANLVNHICTESGWLANVLANHSYRIARINSRIATSRQLQLLLALANMVQVQHPAGGDGDVADLRMADAMLRVLSAQIRDSCLTPLRKSKFAERMGGLTYDTLMDMTATRAAWTVSPTPIFNPTQAAPPNAGPPPDKEQLYAEVALIEAMSNRCGMPLDIYLDSGGVLKRFRVCEDARMGDDRALRLGYACGWVLIERMPEEVVSRKRDIAEVVQNDMEDEELEVEEDDGIPESMRLPPGKRRRAPLPGAPGKKPMKLSRLRPYAIVGMMRERGDPREVWAAALRRLDPTLTNLKLDNRESLERVVDIVEHLCAQQDVKGFRREQLVDLLKRSHLSGCTKPLFPSRDFLEIHLNTATAKYISIGSGLMAVIAMAVECPIKEIFRRENVTGWYEKLSAAGGQRGVDTGVTAASRGAV